MTAYRYVTINAEGRIVGQHDRYGEWVGFSGTTDLMWIAEALDVPGPHVELIWARQDGFGVCGLEAGDWSGIRDSTAEAGADMLQLAKAALTAEQFFSKLGVAVPFHLRSEPAR